MQSEKNRRMIYNLCANVIYRIVIIGMGLLIPRLFLTSFGSEVNGFVSMVKQVLSYLVLLEAGVGLATQQALYKPVAQNDRMAVNGVLSASRIFYNRAGSIYTVIVLGFAGLYSAAAHSTLDKKVVFAVIIVCAVPNALNFFIKQKYALLLSVEGKDYVLITVSIVMELVTDFARIAALMLTDNLIIIQMAYCISPVVQSVFVLFYVHKNYSWINLHEKPNMTSISQKSAVLIHQISGTIFNNVDIILLSIFCDLKTVSVYTVYMMFFSNIEQLVNMISNSVRFRLGQMFQVDREKFIHFHDLFETCYMMLIFSGYTVTVMFLLPVVALYTADVNDADYIRGPLVLLFVLINLLANGKLPSNQMIEFAGEFESTKYHALIEMGINIVVSVFAVIKWGIYGGLIGTIVALLFRSAMMIHVANKKILHRGVGQTYRRWLRNIFIFLIFFAVFGTDSFMKDSIAGFIMHGVGYAIVILIVYGAVNLISERKAFRWGLEYFRTEK